MEKKKAVIIEGFEWDCDCALVEKIFVRGMLLNNENSKKKIGKEDEKEQEKINFW